MRLLRLAGRGFRNLAPFDLPTDGRFVVFSGPNAQGKTNALEAVYLLATLKGLRSRRHRDLVQWGADEAAIAGDVHVDGITRAYRVELGGGSRKAWLDGKTPSDLADYFAGIRAIAFTPQDGAIVASGPSRRRNWLDRAAFTASPAHLDVVRTYRRCLEQKSAALKSDPVDRAVLDALDHQVAVAGARLVGRRVALLRELAPHVRAVHADIAGGSGKLSLRYRTAARGDTLEERVASLSEALAGARRDELRRRITLVGPQTDDVEVRLDDRSARTYASRGQVRSLVLSLKLAELVAARERGDTPLFLLDDLSSELDRRRTERLVSVLVELGAQVFVTTTDPGHIAGLPESETVHVAVEDGRLSAKGAGWPGIAKRDT